MLPVFAGVVEEGRLKLDEPQEYGKYKRLLEGKRVQLILRKYKTQRSIQQNRWLWGVAYKLIAEMTGHDEEEIHDILKRMFLAKKVFLRTKRGVVEEFMGVRSTTKLTTTEFNIYKEKIQRWASEDLGLVIPDPSKVEPEIIDLEKPNV